MKVLCAFAILATCGCVDDESVLVQQPDWGKEWDRHSDSDGTQKHKHARDIQRVLVKSATIMRLSLADIHKHIDKAEMVIIDKRAKLDHKLTKTTSLVEKVNVMGVYMNETLPLWQKMMVDVTANFERLKKVRAVTSHMNKLQFFSDYLDATNHSLDGTRQFIDSMSDLQTSWEQSPTQNDADALERITTMQNKVDEGMKVFQQSERDFTTGFDNLSAKIQDFGKTWGTDQETMTLTQEVTDQIHQECHSIGRQVLHMFSELVGGMDDGRLSLSRQVMAAQKTQ